MGCGTSQSASTTCVGFAQEVPIVSEPGLAKQLESGPAVLAKKMLMLGNPGKGKSSLLNCYIGGVKFKAGISEGGRGVTNTLCKYACPRTARFFFDTPGLNDCALKEEAAKAIDDALKTGGEFSLVFCFSTESGRLSVEDLTTLELILKAVNKDQTKIKDNQYAIVVNKISRQLNARLQKPAWVSYLQENLRKRNLPVTEYVHFAPHIPKLEGDNKLCGLHKNTKRFLDCAPMIELLDTALFEKVKHEQYKKVKQEIKKMIQLRIDMAFAKKERKEFTEVDELIVDAENFAEGRKRVTEANGPAQLALRAPTQLALV